MAFVGDTTIWPNHATVHVPQHQALADLLRDAGPWSGRAGLASAALPGNGATGVVTVLNHHIGAVADELGQALVRARETGAEGADELAAVAGQFGIREVTPEPAPVPEPEPETAPEPAPTL